MAGEKEQGVQSSLDDAEILSPVGKKATKKDGTSTKKTVKKKHKSEMIKSSKIAAKKNSSQEEEGNSSATGGEKPSSLQSLDGPKTKKATLTRNGSARSLPGTKDAHGDDDEEKLTKTPLRKKLKSKKLKELDPDFSKKVKEKKKNNDLLKSMIEGGANSSDDDDEGSTGEKSNGMKSLDLATKKKKKKPSRNGSSRSLPGIKEAHGDDQPKTPKTPKKKLKSKKLTAEIDPEFSKKIKDAQVAQRAKDKEQNDGMLKSLIEGEDPVQKKRRRKRPDAASGESVSTEVMDDSASKVSATTETGKSPKKEKSKVKSLANAKGSAPLAKKNPATVDDSVAVSPKPTATKKKTSKPIQEGEEDNREWKPPTEFEAVVEKKGTKVEEVASHSPVSGAKPTVVDSADNPRPFSPKFSPRERNSDFMKVKISVSAKKVISKPLLIRSQSSKTGEDDDASVSPPVSEAGEDETIEKDETFSSSLGAADFAKCSPTGEEDNHRDENDSAGESQTTPEASIPVSVCASDNVALDDTPTSPVKNEEAAIKPERSPLTPTEVVEHEKSDVLSTVPSTTAQSDETPTSPVRTEETSHKPNRSPSTPIEGVKPSGLLAARKSMFEHEASDVPDWAKRSGSRSNTPSPGPGSRPSVIARQSATRSSTSPRPGFGPRVTSRQNSASSLRSSTSAQADNSRSPVQKNNSSSSSLASNNQSTIVRRGSVRKPPGSLPFDSQHGETNLQPEDSSDDPKKGRESFVSPGLKKKMAAFDSSSTKPPPLPTQTGVLGALVKETTGSRGRQSAVGVVDYMNSPEPHKDKINEMVHPQTPVEHQKGSLAIPSTPTLLDSNDASDLMPFITPKRGTKNRDASQFASSKNALIEALTTPARKKKEALADLQRTPRTLKRGFVDLNVGTPRRKSEAKTPGQRFMDQSHHGKDKADTYIESAVNILNDKSKAEEIEKLVWKIEELGGFPKTRRLSMRDNELVGQLIMAVRNDPRITKIHVDATMFGTISSTLLKQFIDALRINLHVRSLSFHGVELGNDFLYDLAASMESNFVVEEIDLSTNCFTNEGLANFCQALATTNESVKHLNLKNQTTPISEASEMDVFEALGQNTTLTKVELDFMSDDAPKKLATILDRNRINGPDRPKNIDDKLLNVLTYEAERAQELWEQQQAELQVVEDEDYDWDYLYELALLFDKHKLKKEVEENAKDFAAPPKRTNADDLSTEEKKKFLFGEFKKNMEESVLAFNQDGSFLTPEFIAKYFKERPDEDALDFDFHGQWKLFKRFPIHDPARQLIVEKFVDAIVTHPRANEITGINMANTGAGDDFLQALSQRCLGDSSLLPNLHTVNFETNFINEPGVVALAEMIASPTTCRYMQVIRLENQKGLLKSKAEFALAKALRVNRSIVVVSLTIRNLLERERIGKYVMRNVDLIRQARQQHMKATGTQRKRNKVEEVFDNVKSNDENLTKVSMVGNDRFLTLTRDEKIKAARSFAHNRYVTELLLNACGIDDEFARALGESFATNATLERVHLEMNDISGEGIKALFNGLAKNSSIKELRLHKQSKMLASSDEEILADIIEENLTITKIGIDLRSKAAQVKLDRKTGYNIQFELREKAAAAEGEEFDGNDSFAV